MKLKEILVQELPKRGGWPKGAEYAFFNDVQIGFYMGNRASFFPEWTTGIAVSACKSGVTKEQYEEALAASTPIPGSLLQYGAVDDEWDGSGMPPVGCECEMNLKCHGDNYWKKIKVLWADNDEIFYEIIGKGVKQHHTNVSVTHSFRPIPSESDNNRDEAVKEMTKIIGGPGGPYAEVKAAQIYDAIAAGKIPGVHIE